jgi:predicted DNA-binding transcriptional regulator AlpA
MPEKQSLATVEEVAKYLGVPVATLAQWRYLAKGPRSIKVGRYCRYRWGEVEKWLDGQSRGGHDAPC